MFQAAEDSGFIPTGEYFQLNSYENRVFDLFLQKQKSTDADHVICKVYRPGRWSLAAVQEEHDFLEELKSQGIPAVAPYRIHGKTAQVFNQMIYSFTPKARGRLPQEFTNDDLVRIGRQLAKLHNVGAQKKAVHRPSLDVAAFGWDSLDYLESWVAPEMWPRYEKAAVEILHFLNDEVDPSQFIRIHGDCHRGNILQTDPKEGEKEFFFIDFDDFINGLPVQDFWMLFSSDEKGNSEELQSLLTGYEELRHFDDNQLRIMPGLRGLRIIYYANWIARRWQDPTFPKLFPEFENYIYWAEEVEALERIAWSL